MVMTVSENKSRYFYNIYRYFSQGSVWKCLTCYFEIELSLHDKTWSYKWITWTQASLLPTCSVETKLAPFSPCCQSCWKPLGTLDSLWAAQGSRWPSILLHSSLHNLYIAHSLTCTTDMSASIFSMCHFYHACVFMCLVCVFTFVCFGKRFTNPVCDCRLYRLYRVWGGGRLESVSVEYLHIKNKRVI